MRLGLALVPTLLAATLLGCVTGEPVRTTALLDRLRPFHGPGARDVIQMDVALIERPVGDRFLDQDLWTLTDEQAIGLEHKALLEDNGFRIGQVGGLAPAGLQDLLTSERSCVNPQRIQMHSGGSKPLPLGPSLAECHFELRQDGRKVPVNLAKAECLLVAEPTLTPDGRTCLHFTPQIRHGNNVLLPRPAADHSGWERQRPTEEYRGLSWDVVLAPNEYVLIGTRYDHPGTLGHQCFLATDGAKPMQRILAIRTGRPAAGLEPAEEGAATSRCLPLALQASWSCARGSNP